MIIDYTNLQPGDKAPDPLDSPTPEAQARPACANVIVLAADPTLIDLLRDSLAGIHRVWRADDATHAADLLVASANAVLLIDSSLADHDTRGLVNQIHKQFPDLAIIVAGRRDDEAELAPLVSSGAIFRFLHKPASAERIRNFVDATQRRAKASGDQPASLPRAAATALAAAMTSATAERPALVVPKIQVGDDTIRRWSRRALLLVPVLVAVWGLMEWRPWESRTGETTTANTAAVAPADPANDPRVLKLLDSAGVALSQGRLIEPPKENALELYRAVLARDPGNRLALRGIDTVADELLVAAERALMEQDLTRLASAVDAARAARPDHPRLEFFINQLDRERQLQAKPGAAPTTINGEVGRALDAGAAQSTAGRAQGLVLLANDRMRSNKLVGGKDSAHAYLLAARKLDPADPGVQQGMTALSALLQINAQQAIREGRLDEANQWLIQAVALNVNQAQIAAIRADLEAARVGNVRADRSRLLVLANQRLAQGRLIEPAGDSARHYVDLLRSADPAFEGLPETSALLATRTLAESRQLLADGNADRADAMLRAAADAGAPTAEVSAVAAQIAAARAVRPAAAANVPNVLPESAMRRTRFSPPVYPERALERGVQGWVDVEFTVLKDGTTGDAKVVGAEPANMFERAALAAVNRWRYEPRMVGGTVIDQRVQARLRFEMKD